jgi:hypothetical protein
MQLTFYLIVCVVLHNVKVHVPGQQPPRQIYVPDATANNAVGSNGMQQQHHQQQQQQHTGHVLTQPFLPMVRANCLTVTDIIARCVTYYCDCCQSNPACRVCSIAEPLVY